MKCRVMPIWFEEGVHGCVETWQSYIDDFVMLTLIQYSWIIAWIRRVNFGIINRTSNPIYSQFCFYIDDHVKCCVPMCFLGHRHITCSHDPLVAAQAPLISLEAPSSSPVVVCDVLQFCCGMWVWWTLWWQEWSLSRWVDRCRWFWCHWHSYWSWRHPMHRLIAWRAGWILNSPCLALICTGSSLPWTRQSVSASPMTPLASTYARPLSHLIFSQPSQRG